MLLLGKTHQSLLSEHPLVHHHIILDYSVIADRFITSTHDCIMSTIASTMDDTANVSNASPQDITDCKWMARSIPAIVYTYTVNHDTGACNFPYVSDYCEEMFDLPPSKIIDDSEAFVNLIHPDDVNEFTASVLESMRNLTIWDFKMRMYTADKSRLLYTHGKSRPSRKEIINKDQTVTKMTVWHGVLFDITNTYQEENNDKFGKNHHNASLNPSPFFTMNKDGIIGSWSHHMTKLTDGFLATDVIGKNLSSLTTENHQAKSFITSILDQEVGPFAPIDSGFDKETYYKGSSEDLMIISKNDREVHLRVSYVKDNSNDIISCICEDITEYKELEKEKLNAIRLLDAEKNLSEWLAHEIRNPLTVALEAAESLKQGDKVTTINKNSIDSSCQGLFMDQGTLSDLIINSITYVVDLLSKMLDLNKVVEGKIALRPSICYLKEDILEPITQMMNIRKKNLSISIQGIDMKLYIDKLRLKQVLTNLVSNALKFTNQGFIKLNSYRSKKVKVGESTESLFITVSDSGKGIETKELLFSKWETLGSSVNGAGIGLCLSRFLVEAMGGQIYLNENYQSHIIGNPGAQFVIELPIDTILASNRDGAIHNVPAYTALSAAVKASEKMSSADVQSKSEAKDTSPYDDNDSFSNDSYIVGKYKILLVDDSNVIRKLFKRRLTQVFPEAIISEADSGEKALDCINMASLYDLIFIDQYMGDGIHGDETIKELRDMNIDSLIFGISGNDKINDYKAAGAEGFMQKPLPNQKLFLERILPNLAPPTGWNTLVVVSDIKLAHFMERKLYKVAVAHFTTLEMAEKHMQIDLSTSTHDARLKIASKWYDLLVIDEEFYEEDKITTFARNSGMNKDAIVVLNSSLFPKLKDETSKPFDIHWIKPLPPVEHLRKSLITELIRPKKELALIHNLS